MPNWKKGALQPGKRWGKVLYVLLFVGILFAAVMYLRVTVNAPLGGDDCCNNPSGYYAFMQKGVWQLLAEDVQCLFQLLLPVGGRQFGAPVIPRALSYWARQDVQTYRLYIIGVTCLTMAIFAWLMRRVCDSRGFGGACLALIPLTFCLWYDYQLNGMYSYSALPQTTLLMGAISAHCTVSWSKSRHWPWAVAAALTTYWACSVYELGYVHFFMTALLTLSLHKQFRDWLFTLLPSSAGEGLSLVMYLISRSSGNVYNGVQVAQGGTENRFFITWLQQMSGGFPMNELLAAGVQVERYTKGDFLWAFILALPVGLCLLLIRRQFTLRQYFCWFGCGTVLLAIPAALIAVTSKYQTCGWITWESAYIPAVVESFGVALMALCLIAALFQWLRQRRYGKVLCSACSLFLVIGLTAMGATQRAATRERYPADSNDSYNRLWRSIESGLVDRADEDDLILCTYDVWGGDSGAESVFFSRYAGRPLNAQFIGSWEQAVSRPDYYTGLYGNYGGYDTVWCGNVLDESARLLGDVIVYVDNTLIPPTGIVKYYVDNGEGETLVEIPLSELEHSETDIYNGYFITLPDENIVAPKIMIWA